TISTTQAAGSTFGSFPGLQIEGSFGPETGVAITEITSVGGGTWQLTIKGEPNTAYEFRSSTTLDFNPGMLVDPLAAGVPAVGTINGTSLTTGGSGDGTVRVMLAGLRNFVRAQDVPPPPPLLEENFDGVAGPGLPAGWSTGAGATAWEVGDPFGGPAGGPQAAVSALNCAGTGITTDYAAATTYSLVSPAFAVPAGGATLSFQQFIDTDLAGDEGAIRILDADNADALIEEMDPPGIIEAIATGWSAESFPLPASALGMNIKIEFRFVTNDNTQEWAGFYVDDVLVEAN
ncbi:MAG: hypothetical protein GY911_12465, partial [Actinomycetales bacterium]|nr:hypothetical protein [Actinomycetales bacterium]